MGPTTKSALAGLLALACAVAGALDAQRVLRENHTRAQTVKAAPAPQAQAR